FAMLSAAWVLPSLIGPTIAGLLAQHASWRLVFLVVPLVAVPATLVILPRLSHLERPQPVPRPPGRGPPALARAGGGGRAGGGRAAGRRHAARPVVGPARGRGRGRAGLEPAAVAAARHPAAGPWAARHRADARRAVRAVLRGGDLRPAHAGDPARPDADPRR